MGTLEPIGDDIWVVSGPRVDFLFGLRLPTRMVVIRLRDGALWINSPVSTTAATLQAMSGLGPVRYLVAPTPLHLWRLEQWHSLFPQAWL